MNVSESPKWIKEFKKKLESDFGVSKFDAMCMSGTVLQCMRIYARPLYDYMIKEFKE